MSEDAELRSIFFDEAGSMLVGDAHVSAGIAAGDGGTMPVIVLNLMMLDGSHQVIVFDPIDAMRTSLEMLSHVVRALGIDDDDE